MKVTGNYQGIFAEVATATNEQSQGIDQVNTAVAQMEKAAPGATSGAVRR